MGLHKARRVSDNTYDGHLPLRHSGSPGWSHIYMMLTGTCLADCWARWYHDCSKSTSCLSTEPCWFGATSVFGQVPAVPVRHESTLYFANRLAGLVNAWASREDKQRVQMCHQAMAPACSLRWALASSSTVCLAAISAKCTPAAGHDPYPIAAYSP